MSITLKGCWCETLNIKGGTNYKKYPYAKIIFSGGSGSIYKQSLTHAKIAKDFFERFDIDINNTISNTDINNYIKATDALTKRGYFVFRMGVVAKKPFSSKNPKII